MTKGPSPSFEVQSKILKLLDHVGGKLLILVKTSLPQDPLIQHRPVFVGFVVLRHLNISMFIAVCFQCLETLIPHHTELDCATTVVGNKRESHILQTPDAIFIELTFLMEFTHPLCPLSQWRIVLVDIVRWYVTMPHFVLEITQLLKPHLPLIIVHRPIRRITTPRRMPRTPSTPVMSQLMLIIIPSKQPLVELIELLLLFRSSWYRS
mmetsp:Transcript_4365/g.9771  ORF Transcript_4365/g.9771 Transcript_4365/m.9771 type:complete len:208 (+) Transcript_4365:1960-2583(+)